VACSLIPHDICKSASRSIGVKLGVGNLTDLLNIMKQKIKCDECQQETINVSTSEITDEGFIITINKCTNCGFQKDVDSFFKDLNLLSGNTVKFVNECDCVPMHPDEDKECCTVCGKLLPEY